MMMEKLERSWTIFKKSLSLLKREKKLLIFPVISAVCMFFLILFILGGAIFSIGPENLNNPGAAGNSYAFTEFFCFYFLAMFTGNFCTTAFYHEIMIGLHGNEVSIRRGFIAACHRFNALVLWTLVAATVGVILHIFQKKSGVLTSFMLKLVGMAWAVVTCFAIPVIVCDHELMNPFKVLNRSAVAIKETWGESLIGFVGIQSLNVIAVLLFLPVLVLSIFVFFSVPPLGFALAGCSFLALFLFLYLVGTAQSVYKAALYLYADGERPILFSEEEFSSAFSAKRDGR